MNEINKLTGRDYQLFNYYGAPDADRIIIAMGSACDAIEETVDYLNGRGEKVGLVNVHLFRPFSVEHLLKAIPETAGRIAVLDRTKEPGALGEPLYQDVCTAYFEADKKPLIVAGRYGLGSKDVTPAQIIAVYDNLKSEKPKNHFTIGIVDDVTNLSLPLSKEIDVTPEGTYSCKFWGLGSDGTVGANKNSIKIIGDHTDMYAQAYFSYDSKKSGGITQSHLRFGKKPIRSTYLVKTADFVACHNSSYVDKYDMLSDLKDGGVFLLNCIWSDDELNHKLPAEMKRQIARRGIRFYTINGTDIAADIGLGGRINTILQSAFFKLANIIPIEEAVKYMKKAIVDSYGKKGEKVVNMNYAAVDAGVEKIHQVDVPAEWSETTQEKDTHSAIDETPAFISDVVYPINAQNGDSLPVSTFAGREDGTFPQGTAAYEKRGTAVKVPEWIIGNCIQCNQCSYVCPHAVVRPFLATADELKAAPEKYETKKAIGKGLENYQYRIQVSVLDCTGCGNCAQVCPAKQKALVMEPSESQADQIENWKFATQKLLVKPNPMKPDTVKGSQFETPLLEFSGACAGCGETPYAKLITQLFGDRMYIANATGCSSIWGGSAPSTPYTTNYKGQGPAWANSLFEDNAEYGFGMQIAVKQRREKLADQVKALIAVDYTDEGVKTAGKAWLDVINDGNASKAASEAFVKALEDGLDLTGAEWEAGWIANGKVCGCDACTLAREILENKDMLVKKSVWVFGGDGWAYDIGFGGLDHVLASGADVNIMVFDTEVYSNTGGQASKSTPTAAIAQFAASGKKVRKKDLGMIAMSYGYVYVAQVAMGANQAQTLKAIQEAESYPGPSIILAYAPCINHGINMSYSQLEIRRAVDAGYWHMYRFNPLLEEQGKNPFVLDSKDPTAAFREFIESEVRYSALKRTFPETADELFSAAETDAKKRLASYKRLAEAK
jgi:pyruvate-ferredoxin/flavodoxin oxidoreductase